MPTHEILLDVSRDALELLFRSSADCVKLLSLDGTLQVLNPGGAAVMELDSPDALVGLNWIQFWTAEERPSAEAALAAAVRGGIGRCRGFLPTGRGTPKWWDSVLTPVRGPDGAVSQVLIVSRDVSIERDLLMRLETANRRINAVIKATAEIVWYADGLQQRGQGFGLEEFTGIDSEGCRAGWLSMIHPDDIPHVEAASQNGRAAGAGYVSEYRLRHHSGTYRWVEDRVVPLQDGAVIVEWVGVITDIHDRLMADQALRDSEERLRLAVQAGHVGIWDVDLVTEARRWSKQHKELLGLPEDAVESEELFFSLIHPDDLPSVKAAHRTHFVDAPRLTFRIRRFDTGEERWILSSGQPVLDEAGRPVRRLGTFQDVTERKHVEQKLWAAANQDPLTALPNRALLSRNLERAVETAACAGLRVALLVVDLDHFKEVNDTLGHEAGDAVLREQAKRLLAACPATATVARLGGDEFAVLVPEAGSVAEVCTLAEQFVSALGQSIPFEAGALNCQASVGLALFPDHDPDRGQLLKNADMALYAAKRNGRARYALFDPAMRLLVQTRVAVLRRARDILAADAIVPFYQPKVAVAGTASCGFEALLRWRGEGGIQGPASLADAFAEPDLAVQIGERMLKLVLDDLAGWRAEGLAVGSIAINVAGAEFLGIDVAQRWLSALERAGLPPTALQMEVTEHVFLGGGGDAVGRAVRRLHGAGVGIALDDFGTGYASLTHLRQHPVDWLKIDRSFIGDLEHDEGARAIVTAVIGLAHGIGLKVVAEGVETASQAAMLRQQGCDLAQGYLIAKPMPASRVAHFLRQWSGFGSRPEPLQAARGR